MPDLGAVAYLIAISYGMGVLWYTILGRSHPNWMRMAALPFLGLIIGEALWVNQLSSNAEQGLVFLGVHIYVALVATFIGALVDIGASWLAKEHPVSDLFKGFQHTQHPTIG